MSECEEESVVNARLRQQRSFLSRACEQPQTAVGVKQQLWMVGEGEHGGFQSSCRRSLAQIVDNKAVAAVHAVKHPYRCR